MTVNPLVPFVVRSAGAVAPRRLSRSLVGLSLTGLMLAGTALAPASAQVLNLGAGSQTFNRPSDFGANTEVTNGQVVIQPFADADPFQLGVIITDSGGIASLTKIGTRALNILTPGSNFSGVTDLNSSLTTTRAMNVLSANSIVDLGPGATLDLAGFNQTVAGLRGPGLLRSTSGSDTPTVLTINGTVNTSFAGLISNAAGEISIVKAGSAQQSFTNAGSTFSGGVLLNGGFLAYGADGSLGTGALTVGQVGARIVALAAGDNLSNNVVLNADVDVTAGAQSTRWSGLVSGNGRITKIGAGQLILSNSENSFTGGISLQNGFLTAGGSNVFGTGVISFDGSSTQFSVDGNISVRVSNNIVLNGNANFNSPGAGNTLELDGDISGTGGLLARSPLGGGTLLLTGDNSFSGGVAVQAGNIGLGSNTALGLGSLQFSPGAGGLVALVDGLDIGNTITFGQVTNIDTGDFELTLSGGLANRSGNVGGVRKVGTGTLIVAGNGAYTGGTTVDAGTLQVDGTLGGNVLVNGGTLAGSGTIGGTLTAAAGSFISPGNSPETLNVGGNFVINPGATLVFELTDPNVVGGGVNDLINVAGNLTLGGSLNVIPLAGFQFGTYTIINYGGTLDQTNPLAIGMIPEDVSATVITAVPGSILLDLAFNGAVQYWDGAGPAGDGTVQGGSGTWNDVLTNWTNLAGTSVLPWADVTAVFSGVGGDVTVVGPKTITGLTFEVDGYNLSGDQLNLDVSPLTIDAQAGVSTIGNVLAGAGSVTKIGAGELVLNGANTFNGLAVNAGTVTVGNSGALGVGAASFAAGTTLKGTAGAFPQIANNIVLAGAVSFDANGGGNTLNGIISGSGPLAIFDDGPVNPQSGFALNGANTFTGAISVTNTLLVANTDASLGNVANTLSLDNAAFANLTSFTTARGITLANTGTFIVQSGLTLTANGVVGGTGTLVTDGGGTLVLGNAGNSYAGGTVITGGTVSIASDGALGAPAGTVSFGGTTLLPPQRPTTLQFTADVTSARDVAIAAGFTGIIDTVGNDVRLDGAISGDGALTKVGSGRLTLTGANTYAAGTNLNAGTLRIEGSDSIGSGTLTTQDTTTFVVGLVNDAQISLTNAIVFDTGTTTIDLVGGNFNVNATTAAVSTTGTDLVLSGPISGDGGFVTANSGTIRISGDNSYAGGTTLGGAAGVAVFVESDTALGTGAVTLNGFAALLNDGMAPRTLQNEIVIGSTDVVVGGDGDLTLAGNFNGAGAADKAGFGTLTLTGAASDFGGALGVNRGTLAVDGALTNAAAVVTVNTGATLSGTGSVAGTVNIGTGATLAPGADGGASTGALTLGNLNLVAGSLLDWQLGQAYALGGALNDRVAVTGNLVLDGTLTVAETAGGTFGLGVYNLFSYGTLTNNGLSVSALPNGTTGFVQNNVAASQINLIVTQPGTFVQYWDGADQVGNGVIDGGTAAWTTASTNWTGDAPSELNTNWQPNSVGVFQGTAGIVDVQNAFDFQGLQFLVDGYTLAAGEGGSLNILATSFIVTDDGVTATIDTPITGAGNLLKQGGGNLVLNGANSYAGGTALQAGTLTVGNNLALGSGALTMTTGTTLAAGVDGLLIGNAIETLGGGLVASNGNVFTLGGNISGAGSISHVTGGNLVLNGDNSFNGLGINAGTVTLGTNTAAGAGDIALNDNATLAAGNSVTIENGVVTTANGLVASNGFTFTINGNVGGDGSISHVTGGNLVLNGDNQFDGLGINAGTVTLGSNTAAGRSDIALNDNATLAVNKDVTITNGLETTANGLVASNGFVFTINGNVGGDGSISHVTGGNFVLNGDNSFDGLGINAGTVTLGSDTAAGRSDIALNDNATLAVNKDVTITNGLETTANGLVASNGFVFTINGNVGGDGSISHVTGGNLVLNGDNSFDGLGINAGTVTLGSDTAAGRSDIALNDNATLAVNKDVTITNGLETTANGLVASNGFVFTINGKVGGEGSISHVTLGNLVLNGDNQFDGLGINAGTVTLGSNTAAGRSDIALNNNATLAANKNVTIANGLVTTANGLVASNGFVFTINGNVGGDGSISHVTGGNLVLNGRNDFDGLGINAGTVTLGSDTAAGRSDIALNDNATLAVNKNVTIANGVVTTDNGLVASNGFVFTINGNVGGDGSISHVTGGNLVLNGRNSFDGLGINAGTVTLGSDTAAGRSDIALNDNATLAVNKNVTIANGVVTTDNGLVASNGFVFTINGNVGGDGSISHVTGGNLVLNGRNSFDGLGINAGTVTLGSDTAAGRSDIALNNNATLAVNKNVTIANGLVTTANGLVASNGFVFTIDGNVGGDGSISHVTGGNLVLNGRNSFDGLGINAGTVTLGSNTAAGRRDIAINDLATLAAGRDGLNIANRIEITDRGIIDTGAFGFTLSGVIGSAGSLTKIGSGTLTLANTNVYAGGTVINAGAINILTSGALSSGRLTINNGSLIFGAAGLSLANNVTLGGPAAFDTAGNAATLAGVISGTGSLTKVGMGALTLTGVNTYSGGTTISGGALIGNSLTFGTGNIVNNASLVFNQAVNGSFAPVISGTGSVSKQGVGQLILSGNSTYTGATTVSAGDLRVAGALASTVTVGTGGTLSGTGTVGGLVAQSGSTVAPGNSAVGTLNVAGPVTFQAGSTFAAQVTPAAADRITATGAASLAGTLALSVGTGPYTFGTGYTLLSASALTGTFTTVTGLTGFGGGINPLLSYTGNQVRLTLAAGSLVAVGGSALTGNALEVARAFDRAVTGGYNPSPFFSLYTQGTNLPVALSQLSGEIHSAERRVAMEDTRVVRETAFDRLNAGMASLGNTQAATSSNGDAETTFWLRGVGSWGAAQGDAIGSRFTTEQIGVLTGVDYAKDGFKIGAGFTYTQNDIEFVSLGTSRVKSTGGVLYAGYRDTSGLSVGVGASLAGTKSNSNRAITVTGLGQSLRASVDGTTYQLFGELAYDLAASEKTSISPFARYAYVSHRANAFGETGGIAAVNGVRQTYDISVVQAGLRAGFDIGNGNTIVGSAAWQNVTGDRAPVALLGIAGLGQSGQIRSAALDKNSAALEAKVNFKVTEKATLGVGYNGVIGDRNTDHGARATLTVGF